MALNISLKQLHVFVSITQHNTLTAAAEAIFLSKAAASMALSELEKQLGHLLFDRVNHRLILNQEGQKLLPLADELLSRANNINQIFELEASAGTLKIGASDTVGNHVAPSLLSDFRASQQHFSQRLFISNSALICQKLLDFELDIALIEGQSHHPDLISTPFSHDEMCVISAVSHVLTTKKVLSLSAFNHSHWVLREPGSGSRNFFLSTVAPTIEPWFESLELNTTESLINCVAEGIGLGCLSKLAAQYALNDGRVTQLAVPINMQRRFWIVIHKNKYQNPLLKRFIEFCHQWGHSGEGI